MQQTFDLEELACIYKFIKEADANFKCLYGMDAEEFYELKIVLEFLDRQTPQDLFSLADNIETNGFKTFGEYLYQGNFIAEIVAKTINKKNRM